MKKLTVYTLLVFTVLITLSTQSDLISAKQSDRILYETHESTDFDTLVALARFEELSHMSVALYQATESHSVAVIRSSESEEIQLETRKVTQRLKSVQDQNGTVTTTYVTNNLIFFDDGDGGGVPDWYDESSTKTGWDGSIGIKALSRIYWTVTTENDYDFFNLVRAEGQWFIFDYQLSIGDKNVVITQNGFYWHNGILTETLDQMSEYPNSAIFDYWTPTTWTPVIALFSHNYGVTMTCEIIRGLGSWEFTFDNYEYYNVM